MVRTVIGGLGMGAAIRLREDFDAGRLRSLAKRSRDGAQSRRLLALAAIYDGQRRTDAARLAGVGLQIVRDWVMRFNAEGPDGLLDRKAPGPRRKLNEEQRRALAGIVESGPDPAIHGVVRWRRCDLAQWLREHDHRGTCSASRWQRRRSGASCAGWATAMSSSRRRPRPADAQDEDAPWRRSKERRRRLLAGASWGRLALNFPERS